VVCPSRTAKSGSASLAKRGLRSLRSQEQAWEMWNRGRELAGQNRFDEALSCFREATELHPHGADWQWGFTFALDALHWDPPRTDLASANWYRIGAEMGFASAQCRLGSAYLLGHGVCQDFKQAAQWYARAALQDSCEAQVMMGCTNTARVSPEIWGKRSHGIGLRPLFSMIPLPKKPKCTSAIFTHQETALPSISPRPITGIRKPLWNMKAWQNKGGRRRKNP
jgi:TPR repeat protein